MRKHTIIVTAAQAAAVRASLKRKDDKSTVPPGLDGMFTTPLSTDGKGTPTHYVSSGILSDDEAAWLDAHLPKLAVTTAVDRNAFEVMEDPKFDPAKFDEAKPETKKNPLNKLMIVSADMKDVEPIKVVK